MDSSKKLHLIFILLAAHIAPFAHADQGSSSKNSKSELSKRGDIQKVEKPAEEKDINDSRKRSAPKMADQNNYFEPKNTQPLDAKQDELRVKSINTLLSLLKATKEAERRFELKRRLGEAYVERHDYLRALELDLFSKRYDKWSKNPKSGKEPLADFQRSKASLLNGVKVYESMVDEFPKHSAMDAVIHELAKSLLLLDDVRGLSYFLKIPKDFPKSSLVPDSYLGLGEYYFDKYKMPEAREYYTKVLAYKSHRAYAYAIYKLGWTYYNLPAAEGSSEQNEHLKKSLTSFKLVVKIGDKKAKRGQKLLLRDEALKDTVMVYADLEDIDGAWDYFKSIDETDSFYSMLERMGWIYSDQGKFEKAVTVYQRLLAESPNRAGNPGIHAKLAGLHYDLQQPKAVVADAKQMATLYLEKGSWREKNQGVAEAVTKAEESIRKAYHRLGTMYHDDGGKIKNKVLLQSAAVLYALYLKYFPQGDSSYELRYYLADIQFTLEQFEKAADNFTLVANAQPEKGKYRDDSAFNAVVCMNKVVSGKSFPSLPAAGKIPQPMAIPSEKLKLIAVLDNYVRLLPKSKEGYPMRSTAAQTLFDYGHYKEALQRFEKVIADIPATEQSNAAVRIILSYYADSKQWELVMDRAKAFTKTKGLLNAELDSFARKLYVTAAFERAGSLEKQKKFDDAADAFRDFQKVFPKDKNAARALYNASINYLNAGKINESLDSLKLIVASYPDFELRADVAVQIAETYEKLARFSEAATAYEGFYRNFKNDKRAPAALYNAALLKKGLKLRAEAAVLFREYLAMYPNAEAAKDAAFEYAELLEESKDLVGARAAYLDFYRRFNATDLERSFTARAKAALILSQSTNKQEQSAGLKEQQDLWVELVKQKSLPALEARRLTAKSFFDRLQVDHAKFVSEPMKGGDSLQQEIDAKQKRLERLAKSYQDIISLKSGEYSIASLFQLGDVHEKFGDSLAKIPLPSDLSEADKKKIRDSLVKAGANLRGEGLKFYEQAYKSSAESESFSQWTKRAYEKLSSENKQGFPKIREQQVEPGYVVHSLVVDPSVAGVVK